MFDVETGEFPRLLKKKKTWCETTVSPCFTHRWFKLPVFQSLGMVKKSFQTEAGYWGRGRSAHERPNKPGQWGQVEPSRTRWNLWIVYEASKFRKSNSKISKKSNFNDSKKMTKWNPSLQLLDSPCSRLCPCPRSSAARKVLASSAWANHLSMSFYMYLYFHSSTFSIFQYLSVSFNEAERLWMQWGRDCQPHEVLAQSSISEPAVTWESVWRN